MLHTARKPDTTIIQPLFVSKDWVAQNIFSIKIGKWDKGGISNKTDEADINRQWW